MQKNSDCNEQPRFCLGNLSNHRIGYILFEYPARQDSLSLDSVIESFSLYFVTDLMVLPSMYK